MVDLDMEQQMHRVSVYDIQKIAPYNLLSLNLINIISKS